MPCAFAPRLCYPAMLLHVTCLVWNAHLHVRLGKFLMRWFPLASFAVLLFTCAVSMAGGRQGGCSCLGAGAVLQQRISCCCKGPRKVEAMLLVEPPPPDRQLQMLETMRNTLVDKNRLLIKKLSGITISLAGGSLLRPFEDGPDEVWG